MRKYIALVSDNMAGNDKIDAKLAAQRICEALPDWRRVFETDGLIVLQPGASAEQPQSYVLDNGGGIVLGRLFKRHSGQGNGQIEVSLGGRCSREIVESGGRCLVEEFWGQYVAFIRDESRKSIFALRDPSGGSFCFSTKLGNTHVYFSHIVDVARGVGFALSVNWDFILDSFLVSEFYTGATGFREITEVVPGECHEIGTHGLTRHLCWDPCKIWEEGALPDVGATADAVRNATQYCVDGWASTYHSIIHNLSGGLDSAIVLACLSKSRHKPRILCINYYGETQDSDERLFARRAAEVNDCEFTAIETPYIGNSLDRLVEGYQMWVYPTADLFGIPITRIMARLAQERGADVITSGEGGDHLFLKICNSLIAADYAFMHGLDAGLLKACYDAARMLRTSFWSVLGTAMRYGLFRQALDLRKLSDPIPNSAILESAAKEGLNRSFMHPWMENTHRLPNAKRSQIHELCKVVNRYPSFGVSNVADVVHPLLSQPVMEACIRMPAYMACLDGRDRGLARRAFADGLPREILLRRSKGGTSTRYTRMFVDNIDYLREFILDGILVKQPFMDTCHIEEMLTVSGIENIKNLMQIIKLVATETWLRNSTGANLRLAEEESDSRQIA